MNLRTLTLLSLSFGCTQQLAPVGTPTINQPPGNNITDPGPGGTNDPDPDPDPDPEPAFQLQDGWYEGTVDVDLHMENPTNLGGNIEINTRCDGIAVFEIVGQEVNNGYWECILPGEDGIDINNPLSWIGVATSWQGSLLRWLFGTYDTMECTGELDDGVCSLKGSIDGGFNYDTGQTSGTVRIQAARTGTFNSLLGLFSGNNILSNFINSFGSDTFTIDRSSTFSAGYISDDVVRFSFTDDRTVTDVEYDLDVRWVGTTPPPYDLGNIIPPP